MGYIKAKSSGESLEDHTLKCLQVFSCLKDIYSDLDIVTNYPAFYKDIANAIFFHDFGKAASGFQKALNNDSERWNYRHEILSTVFVNCLNKNDLDFIKSIVLTHHKDKDQLHDYFEDGFIIKEIGYKERIFEMKDNIDYLNNFISKYNIIMQNLGFENNDVKKISELSDDKNEWQKILIDVIENKKYPSNMSIYGKGIMNSCDYLASSGLNYILKPLSDIKKVYNFDLNDIQNQCLLTSGSCILISPTGSGKTEASLFWATNNLNISKGNRIFYILPYTTSINAMYKRLLNNFSSYYLEEECVSLMHGKASYFLYKMYENEKFNAVKNLCKKIYSPYKVTTPFQCLKHFFSLKGYEMGILEMYNGNFIFDEIHAYDARNVGLIVSMCKYLKEEMNANIMVMSATMPDFLKKIFLDTFQIENEIHIHESQLLKYLRHKCNIIDGNIINNLDKIVDRINKHQKVLVVCNTVKKAQEIYGSLKRKDIKSSLLHGKFILGDRERIEQNLDNLNLLVGTQAIEVSLDIDYDVCFTEPAPLDDLIQRFGRINRRKNKSGFPLKGICDVFVFSESSEHDKYVYNSEIVRRTLDFLNNINLVYENLLYEGINYVYQDGFDPQSKKIYEDTRKIFLDLIHQIEPFKNSSKKESDFNNLFSSIECVPDIFREKYQNSIKNGNYYDAMKYCLSLTNSQYIRLKKENRIDIDNQIFIDAIYDHELGLLINNKNELENIF